MNLAFSTKHWDYSWDNFLNMAKNTAFGGIEIDLASKAFSGRMNPLQNDLVGKSKRQLKDMDLTLSSLSMDINIASKENEEANIAAFKAAAQTAKGANIPYITVRAEGSAEDFAAAVSFLEKAVTAAGEAKIVILIETTGIFADTSLLRDLLNTMASDYVASDWQMHATFLQGEDSEKTIQNLGAYVKLVHLMDCDKEGNFTLLGEGNLPLVDMMNALKSINYDGFITTVWDPAWPEGLDDLEIILTYVSNKMKQYDNPSKRKKHLYSNKAHTGNFIWEKESIIDQTFSQVLDRMVEEFPDQIAFKYTTLDYTRTYSQFRDDVDEMARALVAVGVKAGTHVAVWATNIPQWYIAFWATTKIGAVFVSMNTAYKIHEAEYLLRQSDTHTVILIDGFKDSNYKEIIKELCPELAQTKKGHSLHAKRLPFLRNVITVGFEMPGALEWNEFIERANQVSQEEILHMAAQVDVNDVCNMQYTSGTTGFPKGVMLTHHNIVNNGKCIGDRMDLSTAERMMIQVPMFHCFGMVLSMTAAMTHGASIYPLPYFSPRPALACINMEKITCFHGVPTMFIALLQHKDFPKTDFSHMRTGIMAGSPCPIAVMREVVEKMHMTDITIVFGQTEASPGCTMSSVDDSLEVRVGTVGGPLPEIECKIINPETGEDCPDEVIGEFVARGYNIMKGYYKMPKATASAIDKDGWLHTGDLACRTPEGNFRITGRLKDMIIRGGENIYPKEIEEFIYTNPKVQDVQVIGVPDESAGEEVMACVILKKGETMTENELRDFCLANMAKHKVPRYIEFVDSFPMNDAGKILKYKMREQAVEKLGLQKAAKIVTA